ncbi:MAG: hypothetical protein BWY86_01490 [Candidatus Aminicenantes bacterium ADurb.Bin508]|nr:MAG: hypothetical protein BWY86_01490 [Candidatus Aminicenantes bacterium ADurb.Bin508]
MGAEGPAWELWETMPLRYPAAIWEVFASTPSERICTSKERPSTLLKGFLRKRTVLTSPLRRSSKVLTGVESTPLRRKRGLEATRETIFWEASFRARSTISTEMFFTSVVATKPKRIAWTTGAKKIRGRSSLWRNTSKSSFFTR